MKKVIKETIEVRAFGKKARLVILDEILECFQQFIQWNLWSLGSTIKYQIQAEVLIEILEADDCGSHGGFDDENPLKEVTGFKLYDRFLTVVRKDKSEKDIKFGITPLPEMTKKIKDMYKACEY